MALMEAKALDKDKDNHTCDMSRLFIERYSSPSVGTPGGTSSALTSSTISSSGSSANASVAPNDQPPAQVDFQVKQLFVCDSCFKYSKVSKDMAQHRSTCKYVFKHPGETVYKSKDYAIRRVDGAVHKLYCQNLCLFAKLFLDHKSVFFGADAFEFYVVLGKDTASSRHFKPMGFFSKEKLSWDENNLACILVFPPYQRRGLGKLLIEFSYVLSKYEGRKGSPERPLSKFGTLSYMSYWCTTIARFILIECTEDVITIETISEHTYIQPEDVMRALKEMHAVVLYSDEKAKKVQLGGRVLKKSVRRWVNSGNVKLSPVIDESMVFLE
jgi:GNAT superfamily N-acetyltransferase